MRRATPTLPVTPAMFRHFAVLTLVITACIGIFASGENRELVEQQIQAQSAKSNGAQAKTVKAGQPKVVGGLTIAAGVQLGGGGGRSDYVESGAVAGGDSGGGGGGGSAGGSYDAGLAMSGPTGGPPMAAPMAGIPPGSSPPQPAAGPQGPPIGAGPPQKGPPKAQPPRKPTAQEIERMLAAARERSGSASSE